MKDTIRTFRIGIAVLTMALVGAGGAIAQESAGAARTRRTKLVFEAGEHTVKDLVDQSAVFLKRNILYAKDEVEQARKFKLHVNVTLNPVSCEEFLEQIAYVQGFVLVPLNPVLEIYQLVNMRGQHRARASAHPTVMTPEQVEKNDRRYLMVATTVGFKHLDASRAAVQLRPFFAVSTGQGMALNVVAIGDSSLLIQGFAPQVARAITLLKAVDLPSSKVQKAPRSPKGATTKIK